VQYYISGIEVCVRQIISIRLLIQNFCNKISNGSAMLLFIRPTKKDRPEGNRDKDLFSE